MLPAPDTESHGRRPQSGFGQKVLEMHESPISNSPRRPGNFTAGINSRAKIEMTARRPRV